MNKIVKLPDKILVKIVKDPSGVLVAELPEYDLHTEADSFWGLIYNINDIIKLYFDIPQNAVGSVIYTPSIDRKEPKIEQLRSIDFLRYSSPSASICFQ